MTGMIPENREQDLEYTRYLETRFKHNEAADDEIGRYDASLLTLSGGALALSISALQIASGPVVLPGLLGIAWVLFIVCITAVLVSHKQSHDAHMNSIKQLDELRDEGKSLSKWTPPAASNLVRHCNTISGSSFVLGMVTFAIFGIANLNRDNEMANGDHKTSVTQTPFEKGKVVISPPRPPSQAGNSSQQSSNAESGKK